MHIVLLLKANIRTAKQYMELEDFENALNFFCEAEKYLQRCSQRDSIVGSQFDLAFHLYSGLAELHWSQDKIDQCIIALQQLAPHVKKDQVRRRACFNCSSR